jgi:hypothetical protein
MLTTRRRVTTPDGTTWTVGRSWVGKRRLKTWAWRREGTADGMLWNFPGTIFDGVDLEGGVVVLIGVVVIALVLVPLILFGIELLILGCILAIGVVSRSIFGKPWTVTAAPAKGNEDTAVWRVRGWRKSAELIDLICTNLRSGDGPPTVTPNATFIGEAEHQPIS